MLPRSLLTHFSWGKAITTANTRHTVSIFKCVDSSIFCTMYNVLIPPHSYVSARESFYDPIELRPEEGFTNQRASGDIHHITIVIIVHTLIYRVCANIKVRNNNIRKCAPFTKFAKIIDCEHFVTYGIVHTHVNTCTLQYNTHRTEEQ